LPRGFSYAPIPVLYLLLLLGVTILFPSLGGMSVALGVGLAGLILLLHRKGWSQSGRAAESLAEALAKARRLGEISKAAVQAEYDETLRKIEQRYEQTHAELSKQWDRADTVEEEFEAATRAKLELKTPRATAKNEAIFHRKLEEIEAERAARLEAIQAALQAQRKQLDAQYDDAMGQWAADEKNCWEELASSWEREISPLYQRLDALNATANAWFPPWTPELIAAWVPSATFLPATEFGRFITDIAAQTGTVPNDPRLALPGSPQINVPLALSFPTEGSLLFETSETGSEAVAATLNQIILRLLTTTPPGKISFTIIDPVGLGENFAALRLRRKPYQPAHLDPARPNRRTVGRTL